MRYLKWLFTLVLFSATALAQNYIYGAQTPNLIPDTTAQRMVLVHLAATVNSDGSTDYNIQQQRIAGIDSTLSQPGAASITTEVNNFNTQYQADITALNSQVNPDPTQFFVQRDGLVAAAFADLTSELNSTDLGLLNTYVQNAKSVITMSANSDGSPNNNGYSYSTWYGSFLGGGTGTGIPPNDWGIGVDNQIAQDIDGYGGQDNCVVQNQMTNTMNLGNVWSSFSATGLPNLASLMSAFDGSLYAFDSSKNLYNYSFFSNAWVKMPGSVTAIAPGSSSVLYGVGTDSHVYQFNYSTDGWTLVTSAMNVGLIATGADGATYGFFAANGGSGVYFYNLPTRTYINPHTFPHTVVSLSSFSHSTAYVVDSAGGVWYTANGGASWSAASTTGFSGTAVQVNATADGYVYLKNAGGTVYQRAMGSFTYAAIGGGSAVGVFTANSANDIFATVSGNLKRFLPNSSSTYSGYNNYFNYQSINPITDFTGTNVPYTQGASATLICHSVRTVLFDSFMSQFFEEATTQIKATAIDRCYTDIAGNYVCDFYVVPWCWATNTPPDWDPTLVVDSPTPKPWGWISFAACVRLGIGHPWTCTDYNHGSPDTGTTVKFTTPQATYPCTYNP